MVLLTTLSVAKRLNVKTDAVRYLERTGHLVAIRVERGSGQMQRLFLEEDVLRYQARRDEQQRVKLARRARANDA
jgi:DNA-binding transcriptional MerR regulator